MTDDRLEVTVHNLGRAAADFEVHIDNFWTHLPDEPVDGFPNLPEDPWPAWWVGTTDARANFLPTRKSSIEVARFRRENFVHVWTTVFRVEPPASRGFNMFIVVNRSGEFDIHQSGGSMIREFPRNRFQKAVILPLQMKIEYPLRMRLGARTARLRAIPYSVDGWM